MHVGPAKVQRTALKRNGRNQIDGIEQKNLSIHSEAETG